MCETMHLFVRTDKQGSECSVDLDVTQEEWDAMDEQEQTQLINEFKGNVMEQWVAPAESE